MRPVESHFSRSCTESGRTPDSVRHFSPDGKGPLRTCPGPRKENPGPSTFRKIRAPLLIPAPYARKPGRGVIRDLSQGQ